jgi:hypothetical protein
LPLFPHCSSTKSTQQSETLHCTPEVERAFQKLKDVLCSALVLALPDLQQPFETRMNVFQYAIGVILKQGGHSMAYHFENLSQAKLNYNTHDKEFYAQQFAHLQWKLGMISSKKGGIDET